jgi:hypothetical protein
MAFEDPEIIARFDRSYGDKKEELRLERGMYQDKPTYTLRLYWQTPDGSWRWSSQKPTTSGKCWERLNLKARELRDVGAALMLAADDMARAPAPRSPPQPQKREPVFMAETRDDDLPF